MAQQFTSLNAVLRGGPLVNPDGTPSRDFLKWLQGIENKANAINLSAQVVGNISPSVSLIGRSENLGTTVGNIDSSGIVTAAGIDLSRDYTNKSLANVPDSSLRKAMTAEQTNYIAVAAVATSGQSGTARPTAYFDLGSVATVNPELAYDSDPNTFSIVQGGGTDNGQISYRGMIQPPKSLSAATLVIKSQFSTQTDDVRGTPPRGIVRYSLDGGSTWSVVFTQVTSRALQTDSFTLLASQDFTKIWVEGLVNSSALPGSGELSIYDARVDYTLA